MRLQGDLAFKEECKHPYRAPPLCRWAVDRPQLSWLTPSVALLLAQLALLAVACTCMTLRDLHDLRIVLGAARPRLAMYSCCPPRWNLWRVRLDLLMPCNAPSDSGGARSSFVFAVSRHRRLMNLYDKKPTLGLDTFVAPSASVRTLHTLHCT